MADATQLFNGSDGGAVGTLTGYSSWSWGNDPASTALLRTAQKIEGTASVRADGATVKQASYQCTPAAGTHQKSCYLYLTAAPSASFEVTNIFGGGFANSHHLGISTDRRIFAIAKATGYNTASDTALTNGTVNTSSASVVPLNEWFRVETTVTTTTATINIWTSGGSGGIHSTGGAHYTASATGTSIGTYDLLSEGVSSADSSATRTFVSSGQYIYMDRLIVSDSAMPAPITPPQVYGDAAASVTASSASAATRVPNAAAAASVTASSAGVIGLATPSDAASSITVVGSADASVLTTHNAEAAGIVTVSTSQAMTMLRTVAAASTITATGAGQAALDGGADAVVQAIGAASIRIDGETSPGFLYATVSKHILTN